jgi:hypothetical protein
MNHNYIMVGAGGTATHLLPHLHAYLKARHKDAPWMLFILDGDVVEDKNLERQLFRPNDVTGNKATAAAARLNDTEHVRAYPEYLSEENLPRFIRDGDTVFICADNHTVRKRIEDHALTLPSVTVINGGNEKWTGSCQLWVRKSGQNITPRLSYHHPEITVKLGEDRAEMTCLQATQLPGGEQTIIANATAAIWMLTALWRYHRGLYIIGSHNKGADPGPATWTEIQFDAYESVVEHIDQRMSPTWETM